MIKLMFAVLFIFSFAVGITPPKKNIPTPQHLTSLWSKIRSSYQEGYWPKYWNKQKILKEQLQNTFQKTSVVAETVNVPVLFGRYSNSTSKITTQKFQQILFDGPNPTGTMTAFYTENSYGQLYMTGKCLGWYAAPRESDYYVHDGGDNDGLNFGGPDFTIDVLIEADKTVDFSKYVKYVDDQGAHVPQLGVVHTGGDAASGADNIWSHRWNIRWRLNQRKEGADIVLDPNRVTPEGRYITDDMYDGKPVIFDGDYAIHPELTGSNNNGTSPEEIGVFTHEFGHIFGLPDLYDTDYTSEGLGNWCLMAGGAYGGDGNHDGVPSHMSAWCKEQLGWVVPTVVNSFMSHQQLRSVEKYPEIFRINVKGMPGGQYFLVENRQKLGFDQYLLESGLLIYHVDPTRNGNSDENRPLVDLEQADGLRQLNLGINRGNAGDPYPGTSNNHTFDDFSTPNSLDYSHRRSYVGVRNISGSDTIMYADLELPPSSLPELEFDGITINDVSGGNGNGILEPGEDAEIILAVKNYWGDATNVTATLSTSHWTTSITDNSSSYGLVHGISVVDSSIKSNSSNPFTVSISADAIPQLVPFSVAVTADGGYTTQLNFTIALGSRLLIVDDDDGSVNIEGYITSALNTMGTVYDIWDHNKQGTPPADVLGNYEAVIWDCEWAFPSLDSSDRVSLTAYLNGGGKLFISGQDIGWDMADPTGSEFVTSSGASKTFFETFLKAKYVADDAGSGNLVGVAGDTIGDGISLARNQPGRGASQYPDVVDTLGGSKYTFKYATGGFAGRGGAISYSGNYKLVYFGFGGFESISDSLKRVQVMERILKWLFEYSLTVDKLPNTEDTSNPYPVNTAVTSGSSITDVNLYWDTDGSFPFNKLEMTLSGEKYSASIPAQTGTKDVEYFALVKTGKGYLPYTISKFRVGPDTEAPVVTVIDTILNSIKLSGPYQMHLSITDNIAVDTTGLILQYSVNNGAEQSGTFQKVGPDDFLTSIVPSAALNSGDIVSYYLVAKDASAAKNEARYPSTGMKQFTIGREIVDDFENLQSGKWNLGLWNYTTQFKHNGEYSLTDSPDSTYAPNTERTATIIDGYDLSPFSKAVLRFYRRNTIHPTDTFHLEITNNGTEWTSLKKISNNNTSWVQEELSLNEFVGVGNTDVKIRLRLKSDGTNQRDGIYIDDVEILTNDLTVGVGDQLAALPTEYSLRQNYPNPFNPATTIKYSVPRESRITIAVFDILGREVETLVNEVKQPGNYQIHFDASRIASGIYFYRLSAKGFTDIKKMMLIK